MSEINITKENRHGYTKCSFVCPECKTVLELLDAGYHCIKCKINYPVLDNIPIFSEIGNYYGEVKHSQMTAILENAKTLGYQQALKSHINNSFVYKYAIDESRAKWIEIIPHDKNTRFLDVGCGWGTNTIPISYQVKEIVALDATYERVKFVDIRSEQENLHNVVPVLGSAIKLPFPNESFDVVAFNGVLEWLGMINFEIDPMTIQTQAIREAYRVLKTDGKIYIGIENRYSLRYFLGDHDDHSFMRFTSLMPRRLADFYCQIRTGKKYYTYTHSLSDYKKILYTSGFDNILTYLPWPDYRNPTTIIPLECEKIIELINSRLKERDSISFRQYLYLNLLKLLTKIEKKGSLIHSFCFVGEKKNL
ncbi:methyltransferase domain-containing protein [Desulfobacterales bacterium HSG17]|nr:methyltransferase domain-containing protein [Desulfobacterales bacterium HSG17]